MKSWHFTGSLQALPVGTKEASYFETNVDLENFMMPGGSDIRLNHSYQFNHDAASTWDFYELIKTELGFDASHGSGAIAGASLVATDSSSRRPASFHVADTLAPLEDNQTASQSTIGTSLSGDGHTSFGFSRRFNSPVRTTNRLESASKSADLALLDFATKQPPSNATLPVDEPIGDNEGNGSGVIASDGFLEMLGNAVVPTFS